MIVKEDDRVPLNSVSSVIDILALVWLSALFMSLPFTSHRNLSPRPWQENCTGSKGRDSTAAANVMVKQTAREKTISFTIALPIETHLSRPLLLYATSWSYKTSSRDQTFTHTKIRFSV